MIILQHTHHQVLIAMYNFKTVLTMLHVLNRRYIVPTTTDRRFLTCSPQDQIHCHIATFNFKVVTFLTGRTPFPIIVDAIFISPIWNILHVKGPRKSFCDTTANCVKSTYNRTPFTGTCAYYAMWGISNAYKDFQ